MPQLWFEVLSSVALGVALLSCAYLIVTVVRHPQQMAVMNWVWPITALYFGPVAILAYRQLSRPRSQSAHRQEAHPDQPEPAAAPSAARELVGSSVGPTREPVTTVRRDGGSPHEASPGATQRHERPSRPFWQTVFVGTTHCGPAARSATFSPNG